MRVTKIYSKKRYMEEVKKACYEAVEMGARPQGRIIFYFQTCLTYKSASKKLMDYPL